MNGVSTRARSRSTGVASALAITLAAALLALGIVTGSTSIWMAGKASVAQWLLAQAWHRSVAMNLQAEEPADVPSPLRPWPWADIAPVLELEAPAQRERLLVLDDASGEAMAFGPGVVTGDWHRPAESTMVLGGHRDTHLGFLQHVKPGDELRLNTVDGHTRRYVATRTRIVDSRTETLAIHDDMAGLVLITCWPFNALQTGGPWRYVVEATPIPTAPWPVRLPPPAANATSVGVAAGT